MKKLSLLAFLALPLCATAQSVGVYTTQAHNENYGHCLGTIAIIYAMGPQTQKNEQEVHELKEKLMTAAYLQGHIVLEEATAISERHLQEVVDLNNTHPATRDGAYYVTRRALVNKGVQGCERLGIKVDLRY